MYDKRFLKVKKLGEERYFRDDREFFKFIKKQSGRTFNDMYRTYDMLVDNVKSGKLNPNASKSYWETHINTDNDKLIIGDFIFRIFRGYFDRTSGLYTINILAEAKANFLCANDVYSIFSEEIKNSKAL
ncbi:MAG: hypothetical protein LBI82_00440 [Dysgonamonadaceae bacterium]|jgi:hypothetical protein|nr:hypothetical protein [Dysgonamonadaceae bacterium]